MSRMRDAIRSGWKTSKSFTPSPVLANMIGRPVTEATDSAAPPRASPSSLVSTTPVTSTPSWKAWAVSTAAWPIIASMTNSTSSGWIAARMSAACCMRSASMARRPAVSTMTTSCCARRACSMPARETATGSPWLRVPSPVSVTTSWPKTLPRSGANTGTPARSPTTSSWVTALGRCRSAATSSGVWPWPLSQTRELAGQRRLARALQAGEHDDGRRLLREPDAARLTTEDADELLVDDLDDLLRRVQRLADLGAERALADGVGELLDDRQGDVGVEQRQTDVADRLVDVGLREPPLGAEVLEGLGQAVGEAVEHRSRLTVRGGRARPRPAEPRTRVRHPVRLQVRREASPSHGNGSGAKVKVPAPGGKVGRRAQMPSQVSMTRLTAWATRAGGSGRPSAPVR